MRSDTASNERRRGPGGKALGPLALSTAELYASYSAGATLAETGARVGLSAELLRYRFICDGLPVRSASESARMRLADGAGDGAARTRAMYAQYAAGATIRDVAASFGISASRVHARFKAAGLPLRSRRSTDAR